MTVGDRFYMGNKGILLASIILISFVAKNSQAETPPSFKQSTYNEKFKNLLMKAINSGQEITPQLLAEIAKSTQMLKSSSFQLEGIDPVTITEYADTPITKLGLTPYSVSAPESSGNPEAEKKRGFSLFGSKKKAPEAVQLTPAQITFNKLVEDVEGEGRGIRGSKLYQMGNEADRIIAAENSKRFLDATSSFLPQKIEDIFSKDRAAQFAKAEALRKSIIQVSDQLALDPKAADHKSMIKQLEDLEKQLEVLKSDAASSRFNLPEELAPIKAQLEKSGLIDSAKSQFNISKNTFSQMLETSSKQLAKAKEDVISARNTLQIESGEAQKAQHVMEGSPATFAQGLNTAPKLPLTPSSQVATKALAKEEKPKIVVQMKSAEEEKEDAASFVKSVALGSGLVLAVGAYYLNKDLIKAKLGELKEHIRRRNRQPQKSLEDLNEVERKMAEIVALKDELYESHRAIIAAEADLGLELNRLNKVDSIIKGGSLEGREKLKNNIAKLAKRARDFGDQKNIKLFSDAGVALEKLLGTRYVAPRPFEGNPVDAEFEGLKKDIKSGLSDIDLEREKMEKDIEAIYSRRSPEIVQVEKDMRALEAKLSQNAKGNPLSDASRNLRRELAQLDREILLNKALNVAQIVWIGEQGQAKKAAQGETPYKQKIAELQARRNDTNIRLMEALDRDRTVHAQALESKKAAQATYYKKVSADAEARKAAFFDGRNKAMTSIEGTPVQNKVTLAPLDSAKESKGSMSDTRRRDVLRKAYLSSDEKISKATASLRELKEKLEALEKRAQTPSIQNLNLRPEIVELKTQVAQAELDLNLLKANRDHWVAEYQKFIESPAQEGPLDRAERLFVEDQEMRRSGETLEFHLRKQIAAIDAQMVKQTSQHNVLVAKKGLKEAELEKAKIQARLSDDGEKLKLRGNDVRLQELQTDLRSKQEIFQMAEEKFELSKTKILSNKDAQEKFDARRNYLGDKISRLTKQLSEVEAKLSLNRQTGVENTELLKLKRNIEDTLAKDKSILNGLNEYHTRLLSSGPMERLKIHQSDEKSLRMSKAARDISIDTIAEFEKHNPTTKSLEAQLREKEIERRNAELVLNKHQSQLDKDEDAFKRAHDALADLSPEKVANSTAVSSASRSPATGSGGTSEVSHSKSCQELMRDFLKSTLRLSTRTAIY